MIRTTEADNVRVWDGSQRGHYEVWYLTLNHQPSNAGFWIRYTMESPQEGHGEPFAQLWFAAFFADDPSKNFALNRRVPIEQMTSSGAPFAITIGDAKLGHGVAAGAIKGEVNGKTRSAQWDLSWTPAETTHRHLPDGVYSTNFADTRVLSPGLNVPVTGKITIDGEVLECTSEPGGQTHLWGRKHAHQWAWGHCNTFEDAPGAALETLTVRLKRKGMILPATTLLALYLDGEVHRFTSFASTLLCRATMGTTHYGFTAKGARVRIEGEFNCRPVDMVVAEYSDPDGEPSYCANTEVANLRVNVWRRKHILAKWTHDAELLSPTSGHFEVAAREPDPAIAARHTPVPAPK